MADVAYLEGWTDYQAAGGTREQFLWLPVEATHERGVDGTDRLLLAWPRKYAKALGLTPGKVALVRYEDGTVLEREVAETAISSDPEDPLYRLACVDVGDRLRREAPVVLKDADGWVFREVPAMALTPSIILSNILLAAAPAWIVPGTVTPTDREDLQFSNDNGLSGLVKLREQIATESTFRPVGTTQYAVDIGEIGAGLTGPTIRTGKNLRRLGKQTKGQRPNRAEVSGAVGDDGESTLAWAYWKVTALAGAVATLGPIHGAGGGPIKYDDQFNHANLGFTAHLQKVDGTFVAITDSAVATQQLTLASGAGVSVGDWVRIVASSAGEHLVRLDAPGRFGAPVRVYPGRYESPWDDTLNLNDNPLCVDYTTPTSVPDGYTLVNGTWSKETGTGNWLTGGQSAKCVFTVGGTVTLIRRSRSWYISKRKSTFSATLWIRPTALTNGQLRFQLTRAGVPIGEPLLYRSPLNVWRQLKIEGLNLAADEGTVQTLGFELGYVYDGLAGATGTFYFDSVQIAPTLAALAITWGANAARIHQGANDWLDELEDEGIIWDLSALDLGRAGIGADGPILLGATHPVIDEDLNETFSARVVRGRWDLLRSLITDLEVSSARPRLRKRLSKPEPIQIPFFEEVRVQAASRDTRQASQLLKAAITATSATQVTVTLTHSDLLGGSPTISYAVFGAVYVSGTGLGPYVFTRPANGAGVGRVVFTSQIPGRTDVTDAVDVPEKAPVGFTIRETFTETDTGATLTVVISDDPGARVSGVKFATQIGNAAMSAFGAEDTSVPYAITVNYTEKQPSKIAYQIMGTDSAGTTGQILAEGLLTFKPSTKPGLPNLWAHFTSNSASASTVDLRVEGDADTASIRWAASTSAMPADATVDAASGSNVNARVAAASAGVTVALDGTVYIKARGWSAINAGGVGSDYAQLTLRRDTINFSKTLMVSGSELIPENNAAAYFVTSSCMGVSDVGTTRFFFAPIILPPNVTITAIETRMLREASDTAVVLLQKTTDTASPTTIATNTHTTNGAFSAITSSGLSEVVDAAKHYFIRVDMFDFTAGGAGPPTFSSAKITYTSHDDRETL